MPECDPLVMSGGTHTSDRTSYWPKLEEWRRNLAFTVVDKAQQFGTDREVTAIAMLPPFGCWSLYSGRLVRFPRGTFQFRRLVASSLCSAHLARFPLGTFQFRRLVCLWPLFCSFGAVLGTFQFRCLVASGLCSGRLARLTSFILWTEDAQTDTKGHSQRGHLMCPLQTTAYVQTCVEAPTDGIDPP